MPADLLFEIGCEEIPAKMLTRALVELPAQIEAKLAAARLGHAGVRVLGTPRRIALIVSQLAERQPDLRDEVVGPPVSAAFAPDGTLTKAGQGFAAKNGVDAAAIAKKEVAGKKGLYAVATREVAGQDTRALLPALLVELATGIAWPKSMRWGWGETAFVRPVQWLVALLGAEVIPVQWAGHTAGRHSRGHRFLANHAVEISSAVAYEAALHAAHVIVDPDARKQTVTDELARLAQRDGLRVRPDDALVAEVIHLGEWPVGVSGAFDPKSLEVPEEMIVTAMRNHQRYFAMETSDGRLAPRFATVMATIVRDPAVVARGNETVLASRLADARFFFAQDSASHSFDAWNTKLDAVVFQAKLGDGAKTIGDKVRRLVELVTHLTPSAVAIRAARLCKADLASHAVGEFPELQGTMGRHYARVFGEPAAVGDAIEQHWWPKGQGAALPASEDAAYVGVADRVDTLVGCFATGLVPSGNADPLGLRRSALGVLQIFLRYEQLFPSLKLVLDAAENVYAGTPVKLSPDARQQLFDFIRQRLRGFLIDEEGLDATVVEVALGAGFDNPHDARRRANALSVLPADTKAVFKRIGNILDEATAKGFGTQAAPDEGKLVAAVEKQLHAAHRASAARIDNLIAGEQYADAFGVLAEIGPQLAAFFDKGGVMVMDPDASLRENRLALLRAIYAPFAKIGDFRKLSTGASS